MFGRILGIVKEQLSLRRRLDQEIQEHTTTRQVLEYESAALRQVLQERDKRIAVLESRLITRQRH
jgi:hypothetical protein